MALAGLRTSCARPAASVPRTASFSVWTRFSVAVRSSAVRCSTRASTSALAFCSSTKRRSVVSSAAVSASVCSWTKVCSSRPCARRSQIRPSAPPATSATSAVRKAMDREKRDVPPSRRPRKQPPHRGALDPADLIAAQAAAARLALRLLDARGGQPPERRSGGDLRLAQQADERRARLLLGARRAVGDLGGAASHGGHGDGAHFVHARDQLGERAVSDPRRPERPHHRVHDAERARGVDGAGDARRPARSAPTSFPAIRPGPRRTAVRPSSIRRRSSARVTLQRARRPSTARRSFLRVGEVEQRGHVAAAQLMRERGFASHPVFSLGPSTRERNRIRSRPEAHCRSSSHPRFAAGPSRRSGSMTRAAGASIVSTKAGGGRSSVLTGNATVARSSVRPASARSRRSRRPMKGSPRGERPMRRGPP